MIFRTVLELTAASAEVWDERTLPARLLRARSLLKLQRPKDALAELPEREVLALTDADIRSTARMLRGHALARIDASKGAAVLAALAAEIEPLRIATAVRAEITYFRALAHWSTGELDEAAQLACAVEWSAGDVLAVRAMTLRGFIAMSKCSYDGALLLFRASARAYGRCIERDADLAATIAHEIASLEQTLRSATETGSHRKRTFPGEGLEPVVVTPDRLSITYNDAWLYALDGEAPAAFRKAREVTVLAEALDSAPWRVWALGNAAAIAAAFGEHAGALGFVEAAEDLAVSVSWNATRDNQRLALLQLAEVRAAVAPETASDALRRYDTVTAPMDRTRVLRDRSSDSRLLAWDTFVRGLVWRAQGQRDIAATHFSKAAQVFRLSGYLWREAHALIELSMTTREREPLERAFEIVSTNFPRSFLVRRFGAWARASLDPVGSSLTPAQREVLRFLLEGHTGPEIAALTRRSYNTVRTHIQALHRAFGTHSEHQLVVACARRGIGAPSWTYGACENRPDQLPRV